jgi:DNA-binding transcriptional LysR family regulator
MGVVAGADMQKRKLDLDWDHARVFLAVAREGQLLAAGRRLGLDQATVTRRINALEAALGVRLLDRRTTGSGLTQAGADFLEHAGRIESEFFALMTTLANDSGEIEGTVRIGAPDGFGTLFLAGRFGPLLDKHPRLAVQLVPLPRSFSLSRREADIVITVERPVEGRIKVRKLCDYTLSLYASERYLKTAPPLRTQDDLQHHRLVSYVSDLLFSNVLDFSAELGLPVAPQFQCAGVLGQMEAVKSGLGVGLLHDYAVAPGDGLIRVLPEIAIERTYWLVTHASVAEARPVRAVHEFVVAIVEDAQAAFAPGEPRRTKR